MPKRVAVDSEISEIWKKVEEQAPEAMSNEELLGIFEHLAIAFAKNPRLRGARVFKQRFRSALLERMGHIEPEQHSLSAR